MKLVTYNVRGMGRVLKGLLCQVCNLHMLFCWMLICRRRKKVWAAVINAIWYHCNNVVFRVGVVDVEEIQHMSS